MNPLTAMPMTDSTDYLAPFSLWVCARRHPRGAGMPFVEPARAGANPGPLIFVSRLHAHVYAAFSNREPDRDDLNPWGCLPLQAFGLREYGRALGGKLDCELAYGFVADETGALVVADGAPRVRFVELSFEMSDELGEPTFSFNQYAFEFMRMEWIDIGAPSLLTTFDRIDAMRDAAFAQTLDAALSRATLTRHGSDIEHWAVYDPDAGRWIAAPASVPMHVLTLH